MLRAIALGVSAAMLFTGTSGAGKPAAHDTPAVRPIQEIQFTGNTRFSNQQLSQAIGIKVGDLSRKQAIDAAMARIVAAYHAIGGDLTLMVDITVTDTARNRVNFVIDEDGTGGNRGATPRSGARMGGVPPPPSPATRQ